MVRVGCGDWGVEGLHLIPALGEVLGLEEDLVSLHADVLC